MQTIVLATDFSVTGKNAANYALGLAKYFSARLILVSAYVLPEVQDDSMSEAELKEIMEKRTMDKLKALKIHLLGLTRKNIKIEFIAEEGSADEVLRKISQKLRPDLMVMGVTDDTGFINEFILKSTSIEAAKGLETYSLLVPEKARYKKIKKLALACDFEKTEKTAIPYIAKYFSKIFDAELEIVNVNPDGEELPDEKKLTLSFMDEKLDTVKHKASLLKGTSPKKELRSYFEHSDADILMLAPKKHNFLYYLFDKSVTNNLAGKIDLPVLIIH
ncbi:MAG: UspA protein [Bacteroidetes bacterium]|jgi:nucleotide-binding universal stress UspA family protein|nr:UspA protein [Bacteroidota bacterium]